MVRECIDMVKKVNILCDLIELNDYPAVICPEIYALKRNGISPRDVWIQDIGTFCTYVSMADGYIADEELDLLNTILGTNLGKLQLRKIKADTNRDWEELPLILRLAVDLDLNEAITKNNFEFQYSKVLLSAFTIIGTKLCVVDGDISDLPAMKNILESWVGNMDTFRSLRLSEIEKSL